MRIRVGLVDPNMRLRDIVIDTGEDGGDATIDTEERRTFGEVRPHLAALLDGPCDTFTVDGHEVSDAEVLGEGRLLRGAMLRAAPAGSAAAEPGRMPLGSGALVDLHVVGGPGAGRILQIRRGDHVLGRAASSDARLDDLGVSRAHAVITVGDGGIRLRDLDPTNPTLVDGSPVPPDGAPLAPGGRVRIASTTLVLRRPETTPAAAECSGGTVRINRRPRFVPPADPETIRFPAAPTRPQGARAPVIAAVAPLVISVGLAVVLQSPVMLLFALMSPVMLLAQWWGDRRHGRVSYRAQLAEHARDTAQAEALLVEALAEETRARHAEQPDLAVVGSVAHHRDARIWERRLGDPDHLALRVGTGDQAARTSVEQPDGPVAAPTVHDVPAVVDLESAGVVGVAGPRARAFAVASSLVAQTAVWHSPRTTRLVVISAAASAEADWAWASRLPHAEGGPTGPVATVASSQDEVTLAARVDELAAVVSARAAATTAGGRRSAPLPRYVVVLDGTAELRGHPGVTTILKAPETSGVHVIGIDDSAERLPAECRVQLVVVGGPAPRARLHVAGGSISEVTPDLPHRAWLESLSRSLAPLEDATPEDGATSLPESIGLRAVHRLNGLDPTVAEGLVRAWSSSSGRPTAVLGATREGPFVVDLSHDGPHCLVGGTTGSGKSELLQTLVAGLAVGARPDELGFVLVDYKGGSAFKACALLPHVLGVVTDLDEHLTERALVSLRAELKRREALLAGAGAKDLDDYRRRRGARPDLPPIARLVLVVDEFKVLADELPDFVEGLVRIAAVGRSLGVHLVLATQRPAGIITGDMRANVSLRVALRVRDRSDSEDVIESPAAARISDRTPGRAWFRMAGERLVEVQTAYAGTALRPADAPIRPRIRVVPLTWSDLGRPLPALDGPATSAGITELEAVVAAARDAAAMLAVTAPDSPWLPPLPASLPRDTLATGAGPAEGPVGPSGTVAPGTGHRADSRQRGAEGGAVVLGLEDQPEAQSQPPFTWHPGEDGNLAVAGGARTGRSTLLRTLAVGLAEQWPATSLHLHVIEGSPGSLQDLVSLPHVGSVTSAADPGVAARVVARLAEDLVRGAARSGSDPRPLVVLLVDGWEAVEDAFEAVDHGAPSEALVRLARDGLASGLRLVVTGGRAVVAGRLASVVQRRLVLPLPDPLDLTLAGLSPDQAQGHRGAGRAIDVATGHHVQLAHVGVEATDDAQRRATAELAERLHATADGLRALDPDLDPDLAPGSGTSPDRGRLPWRVVPLPPTVEWGQLPPPTPDRVSLGLGGDDASPVGFCADRHGRRVVIVGGPRSGRTTALATIARQLTTAERPTAVIATRRSPLSWLSGIRHLHLVPAGEGDRLRELRQAHPDLSLLVDDAEGLDGTPVEPVVLDAVDDLERAGAWCVAAVDARRAASLYRGVVPELARHGAGVVLSPTSPSDGDLLGVRVEAARHRLPGRGVIVLDGVPVPLQVADPGVVDAAER